ncbi:hypothetical protein E4U39_002218 [Claviceps sp. Clav50 group G5]|nr:hypothetical protein E4U39_002218 [Claviceps sp. Clav50 group G5]
MFEFLSYKRVESLPKASGPTSQARTTSTFYCALADICNIFKTPSINVAILELKGCMLYLHPLLTSLHSIIPLQCCARRPGMLSSSVRRVVCSATPTGLASALTSSAPRAGAASVPVFSYDLQRRFSSSKPSRPDNEASDLVAGQSVTGSAARSGRKSGTGKRKSKAEVAAERAALIEGFPYVPPTRHISQEGKTSIHATRARKHLAPM